MDWQGVFMSTRYGLHRVRPRRWLTRRKCYYTFWCRGFRYEVEWRPRKGLFFRSRLGRAKQVGALLAAEVTWEMPSMKRRVAKSVLGENDHLAPKDSVFLGDFPALLEHCTVLRYEDGSARQVGWFTVMTQGEAWVITVKDPDAGCSLRVVAATLDNALQSADKLLTADDCPWMVDSFLSRQKGKKKS